MFRESGVIGWQAARGYANRSDHLPNRLNTRYGLASVSKCFTAVTILQLVEEGTLHLEDSLQRLLPDRTFPLWSPDISLHHLLTHTSGIPDYFDESVMTDYAMLWQDRPVYGMRSPADFLPMFADKPAVFPPAERFQYNNSGFILLGLAVEYHTGKPFAEAVKERVFMKAGMFSSGYFPVETLPPSCAIGYVGDGSQWKSNIFDIPPIGGGDGGAWCTVPDLLAFWDALQGGRLLGEEMLRRMTTVHAAKEDEEAYGYGIWLKDLGTHRGWYLQGSDPGVNAASLMDPKTGNAFVVLGNSDHGVWEISEALANRMKQLDT